MNKRQLISAIAKKTEIPKQDIELIIDQYHEIITNELASGRRVQLNNFGTYDIITKKNKNSATSEEMLPDEKVKPKFRYSSVVKDKIESGTQAKRRNRNK